MPLRIPTHREPIHPGEMLLEEFMKPLALTPQDLAAALLVPYPEIAELIDRQRGISTELALRLARYFTTSVGFWLNGQREWEIYHAQRAEAAALEQIQPLTWADIPEVAEGAEVAETPAAAEVAAG